MQKAEREFAELEVAITGRLASMTREEAVHHIVAAGARYAITPGERTDLVVIGRAGLPLDRDGQPTRSIERAQELRELGHDIQLISEEDLLMHLGLHDRRQELQRLFTTSQLARILGVPSSRVRSWVRSDMIRPIKVRNRLCFFGFQQVASARSLQHLLRSGVALHQIRRGLERLGTWFRGPESKLLQLESLGDGGPLLVRLQDGGLAEPGGQLRLEFASGHAPARARPLRSRAKDEWFEVGIRAEEDGRLQPAEEAYRKALATGGPKPEICFNLGNTLYAMDRKVEAIKAFTDAVDVDPQYVEAWNNLGNALSECNRPKEAISAYGRALVLEPYYADAHYNLAETLAGSGRMKLAREHWRSYLRLDPHSPWAEDVRSRLED